MPIGPVSSVAEEYDANSASAGGSPPDSVIEQLDDLDINDDTNYDPNYDYCYESDHEVNETDSTPGAPLKKKNRVPNSDATRPDIVKSLRF